MRSSMLTNIARLAPAGFVSAACLAIVMAVLLIGPVDAKACRDCPFPMRIGKDLWMMPNEKTVVEVHREDISEKTTMIVIYLKDARSQEIIARGRALRRKYSKSVNIELIDRRGYAIKGYIRWVDSDPDTIQAKFTCLTQCSIGEFL